MDRYRDEHEQAIKEQVRLLSLSLFGVGMAECAESWTEDLKVGSSIPAVARGYLIFPAQKDERHQEQTP